MNPMISMELRKALLDERLREARAQRKAGLLIDKRRSAKARERARGSIAGERLTRRTAEGVRAG